MLQWFSLWILGSIVCVPLTSLEGIRLQQISSFKYHEPVECAVKLSSKSSLSVSTISCTEFLGLLIWCSCFMGPLRWHVHGYVFSMSVRDFEEKWQNGWWNLHYSNDTKISPLKNEFFFFFFLKMIGVQDWLACVIFKAFWLLYFKSAVGFIHFSGPQMRWVIVKFYILIYGSEIRNACGSSHPTWNISASSLLPHWWQLAILGWSAMGVASSIIWPRSLTDAAQTWIESIFLLHHRWTL